MADDHEEQNASPSLSADAMASQVAQKLLPKLAKMIDEETAEHPHPDTFTTETLRRELHRELEPVNDKLQILETAIRGSADGARTGLAQRVDLLERDRESTQRIGSRFVATIVGFCSAIAGGIATALATVFGGGSN